jgi:hypothetical protein
MGWGLTLLVPRLTPLAIQPLTKQERGPNFPSITRKHNFVGQYNCEGGREEEYEEKRIEEEMVGKNKMKEQGDKTEEEEKKKC